VTEPEAVPEEGEQPAAEPEAPAVPAVEKIEADIENDLITLTVGEVFTLESEKLNILPAEADWNSLSFEVDNETTAVLKSDKPAEIREDGLELSALNAGETKLRIKAGDAEKVIRVVVEAVPAAEVPAEEPVMAEEPAPVVDAPAEVYEEPAPEPEPEPAPAEEPAPAPEPEPQPEPEPESAPAEEAQPAEDEGGAAEE